MAIQAGGKRGVVAIIAHRREVVALAIGRWLVPAHEAVARVEPGDVDSAPSQVSGSEPRCHQFPQRHDPDAHPDTDFTDEPDAGNELVQLPEGLVKKQRSVEPEVDSQRIVLLADGVQRVVRLAGYDHREEGVQRVGDAFQRRMDDHGTQPLLQAMLDNRSDGRPVGSSGNARASELQDHAIAVDDGRRRAEGGAGLERGFAGHRVMSGLITSKKNPPDQTVRACLTAIR